MVNYNVKFYNIFHLKIGLKKKKIKPVNKKSYFRE